MEPEAIREYVPLARFTTMQVGGPARYLAKASTGPECARLVEYATQKGISWLILGHGSNVIFPDSGYDGLVIVYRSSRSERRWSCAPMGADSGGVLIDAEAGLPLASLVRWVSNRGLSGLEWAAGLPGTLGGAVAGNAGAFDGSMADVLLSALVVWPGSEPERLSAAKLGLSYRCCSLLEDRGPAVVTQVRLRLQPTEPDRCLARLSEVERRRRAAQPVGPSSGCIFRNPPGASAGQLLDRCGLKGTGIGGAVVSERHANFIVNRGKATATDVLALMSLARRRVWEEYGIMLEPEVRLVGDATLEAA